MLISMEKKINDRHLDVDADIPDEPILVLGDNDMITQVIYNLLENAAKFAREGSTLYLGVAMMDGKARITVRNVGETIPAEELPLLFERFHKSDKSRSEDKDGYGLGLYIVKTILQQHKGRNQCHQRERRDHLHVFSAGGVKRYYERAQDPADAGREVIEEYSRDFPAEIVETYSRPLPGAVGACTHRANAQISEEKRRVWKGLMILLAVAAVIALLAAGVRWLIWELQMPDDWGGGRLLLLRSGSGG